MSTISAHTPNRLSGMSSGMDTDLLVKSMVANQQLKLDRISQRKQVAEWRKSTYTEVNNTLRKFKDDFISLLSSKSMMGTSAYKSNTVTMAANNSLKVNASSVAKAGNYSVSILNIASSASIKSTGKATTLEAGYSANVINNVALTGLSSLASGGASAIQDGMFKINGVEIEYRALDSLKTIMDRVNNSGAGVTMSYSQLTDQFTIEAKSTGAYIAGMENPGEFTMVRPDVSALPAVDDENYEASKAQFDAEMEAYNAAFSEHSSKAAAYKANEAKNIKIEDYSGFMDLLGINDLNLQQGVDANFTINGVAKTSSSNSISYDGVDFTLLEATTSSISVTIGRDIQSSVDKVKSFVDELNKMLEGLYAQLTEKKNRKFEPLTKETKEGMTEKEIADWELEAKKGLLYRDNYLDSMMTEIRSAFTANLGGHGNLASIGITTSEYSAGKATTLIVNEDKLRAALESDPDRVQAMFSEVAAKSSDGKGGFVTRIGAAIDRFTNDTKRNALQALDNNIRDYAKKATDVEDRLYKAQERYYAKFAKMEAALAKMQSQTEQLAGYFQTSKA